MSSAAKKIIAIISSCTEDWGGSEELWGKSVPLLLEKGYHVIVYKSNVNLKHSEFVKLGALGVEFRSFDIRRSFLERNWIRVANKVKGKYEFYTLTSNPWCDTLKKLLAQDKIDFALISQGINFDGLGFAYACGAVNIPYAIIAQKAVDFYWPLPGDRPIMLETMQKAVANYFVSKHNLRLTEEQFGRRLPNGHVIFNPQKIGGIKPYPSTEKGIKLACVGRLFLLDKGQDILIRIFNQQKWRDRPVTITFVGSGIDEKGLKEMAALLGVQNVSFAGQVQDMDSLWNEYHALILPSRSEGLPLSMVEAMAAGRIPVISRAGGNTELLDENITGFSGQPFEESFDEAMERAWGRRDEWETMGKEAAKQIARVVPKSPEKDFVEHLVQFIK